MSVNTIFNVRPDATIGPSTWKIEKWGGLAAFLLAMSFIGAELIYLMGNLRDANGPLSYAWADFLYGPLKAACLVMVVFALREHIGERAPRLLALGQWVMLLSAGLFVLAAFLRATNRNYHLIHPELNLEHSQTVLLIWTTLVGGVIATGWHFLGWAFVLIGTAGWTSGRLPRALSVLYWGVGVLSLFVYLLPVNQPEPGLLVAVLSIWQGVVLWLAKSGETPAPTISASQPDSA